MEKLLSPENTGFTLILLVIWTLLVHAIVKGLKTGRPPFQKGIKGTSLADSRPLMYVQIILCLGLAIAVAFSISYLP